MAKEIKKIAYSPDGIEEFIFSGGGTDDNSNIVWVNNQYTGTEEDGTIGKPFKEIQKAVDFVMNSDPTSLLFEIRILAGTYVEDVKIDTITKVITFNGLKTGAFIIGDIIIENTPTIGFNNVSNQGTIILKNNKGFIFDNCLLSKIIIDDDLGLLGGDSFFTNTEISDFNINSGYLINLRNCKTRNFVHKGGDVLIENCILKSANSYEPALISTSDTGSLKLVNGSCYYIYRNRFGEYGYDSGFINKTGSCDYYIGTFNFDESKSTLTGTKLDEYGLSSNQVFDINTRSDYTTKGNTLKQHLDGINTELKIVKLKLMDLQQLIL